MPSINKQTCPTCGQSVNKHEEHLTKGLVYDLYKVWQHCEATQRWSLNMKELKSIITHLSYSKFNNLKHLEPDLVFGKIGEYNFDASVMRDIFTERRKVCVTMLIDPLAKTRIRSEFKYIHEVPALAGFLDDEKQYIARYKDHVELKQASLL